MLDDLNIDDFCKDVALVLVFLYQHFPMKMEIYIEDVSGPEEADDYGLHSERYLACLAAIVWLAEEGLVRYEALVKQESFDQATLTKRAFVMLSTIGRKDFIDRPEPDEPSSITLAKSTRISQIKHALEQGSSEDLKQLIRSLLFLSENMDDDMAGSHYKEEN